MKEFLKKLPTPICGVMLGVLGLGNLIKDYSLEAHYLCGLIGVIILVLLILKILYHPSIIKEELKNPIIASVSGTFIMSLIILSGYFAPFTSAALYLWFLSILLFILLIIYFTKEFILKLNLDKVFASYYIVYIGIVIASVIAPLFNQHIIGQFIVYFGIFGFIFLLPLTMYRYWKLGNPDPFKPLICINAAPFSLILLGYLKSFSSISFKFVVFMFIFAVIFYIFSVIKFIEYRRLSFYPSYSAFGFPFVVAALCAKETNSYLIGMGFNIGVLNLLVIMEVLIAIFLVIYVLFSYIRFLTSNEI